MILHAETPGIAADPHLLDDPVRLAPRLDFERIGDTIQRLVMRAIHAGERIFRPRFVTQRLEIRRFQLRKIVAADIEEQRPAERYIQHLDSLANAQDGNSAIQRSPQRREFPGVALRLRILNQCGVRGRFPVKVRGNIRAAREQEAGGSFKIDRTGPRIRKRNPAARRKQPGKERVILVANPTRDTERGLDMKWVSHPKIVATPSLHWFRSESFQKNSWIGIAFADTTARNLHPKSALTFPMFLPILAETTGAQPALSPTALLVIAFATIFGLILAIARFKCNAIVALTLGSLLLGLCARMDPVKVADSFKDGVAGTLGGLAMIIGLGTILGKLLAESGAAHVIAGRLVVLFGKERLDYAIMVAAFIIGVSVFFQVGVLLLGPVVFALARETRTPILRLGLPLAAGMSTAHGLIPPHPGPLAAINILGADVGKTIAWSLLVVGPPVALLTGPLLARWVAPRVPVPLGGLGENSSAESSAPRRPGFAISLFTMLLPVLLMLVGTVADIAWPEKQFAAGTFQGSLRSWADFIGNPTVAMLTAVLVSFWTFGFNCGLDRGERSRNSPMIASARLPGCCSSSPRAAVSAKS